MKEHMGKDLREIGESSSITSEKLEHAVKQLEERLQEKPREKSLKEGGSHNPQGSASSPPKV